MYIVDNIELLLDYLDHEKYEAIVVEGYDGVGKGRILNILSNHYGVTPYRPDYNFWQQYDHRQIDRWKVSGFFWDVFSHFNIHSEVPMLFDRGVLSGAVYNHDESIARNYHRLLRGKSVLHIIVECDFESFVEFQKIRNPEISSDEIMSEWHTYECIMEDFENILDISAIEYIYFHNEYDKSIAQDLSNTCEGCGHYSYGWCRHPIMNCVVDKTSKRCKHAYDKEVQDVDATEMRSMSTT